MSSLHQIILSRIKKSCLISFEACLVQCVREFLSVANTVESQERHCVSKHGHIYFRCLICHVTAGNSTRVLQVSKTFQGIEPMCSFHEHHSCLCRQHLIIFVCHLPPPLFHSYLLSCGGALRITLKHFSTEHSLMFLFWSSEC